MKCIEAQQLVKPYLEKQLSEQELEAFLDHVDKCPECYDELEIYFSIYEALDDTETDQGTQEYNFRNRLKQDIRISRRYLHLRKAYRFFRFALVMLAEFLLFCTILTAVELQGEEGSKGTTVYRVIYGRYGYETELVQTEPAQSEQEKAQKEPAQSEQEKPQTEPAQSEQEKPQTEPAQSVQENAQTEPAQSGQEKLQKEPAQSVRGTGQTDTGREKPETTQK